MIICLRTKLGDNGVVKEYCLLNTKTGKTEWVSNLKMKMLLFTGEKNFLNATMQSSVITIHNTGNKGALAHAYYLARDLHYNLEPKDIEEVSKYSDHYLLVKFRGADNNKCSVVKVYVRDENYTTMMTPAEKAFDNAAVIEYVEHSTKKTYRVTKTQFVNDYAQVCDNVVTVYKIPYPDDIRSQEKVVDLTTIPNVKNMGICATHEILTEKLSSISK